MREPAPRLTTSVQRLEGTVWVVLAGAVDHGTAGVARDLLRSAQHRSARVALDLSGVGSIDAAGLGVLVAGVRRAEAAGGSLVVARASEAVRDVIRIVGLEHLLDVAAPA